MSLYPDPVARHYGGYEEGLGWSLASAGDVNGDGLADLVVSTGHASLMSDPTAKLWLGSPSGISGPPSWMAPTEVGGHSDALTVSGVGDVNGDGFDDVGVVSPYWRILSPGESRIYIFGGSAAGLSVTPMAILSVADRFWLDVAAAGDVDGDGYEDMVASSNPLTPNLVGDVRLYRGGPGGVSPTAAMILSGAVNDGRFGRTLEPAGDMDGDGFADVIIGEPGQRGHAQTGRVYLYRGSPAGLVPWWQHVGGPLAVELGMAACVADVDGDGWTDVVVGGFKRSAPASDWHGSVEVFFGSSSGIADEAELLHEESPPVRGTGIALAPAGDLNGDGLGDVVSGAPGAHVGFGFSGGVVVLLGRRRNHEPVIAPMPDVTADCGPIALRADADDPDDDVLAYAWVSDCADATFSPDADAVSPVANFAIGCGRTCTLTVTVDDGRCGLASASQRISLWDRTPPLLRDVPAPAIAECDAVPAPAPVTARDACDPSPTQRFEEARVDGPCPWTYRLERSWTANDACGNESRAPQAVEVMDTRPPVVAPGIEDLHCCWPPNGRIVTFDLGRFEPLIRDACDAHPIWRFDGCTASEDGQAVHDLAAECGITPDGAEIWVRSRRSGTATGGRAYGVLVTASDACGNRSEPTVIGYIRVPHDQRPVSRCESP